MTLVDYIFFFFLFVFVIGAINSVERRLEEIREYARRIEIMWMFMADDVKEVRKALGDDRHPPKE